MEILKQIIERLKQKAKRFKEISVEGVSTLHQTVSTGEQWVRLEDVKAILQQLKQNYIVIEEERFLHFFGWLKRNINLNYGGRNREQLLRWVNEVEELLKE